VIETIRSLAKELVDLRPDAIFCMPTLAASGLAPETRTIPIVFAVVGDPIGSGLVTSYARPGRNITGFASFDPAISGKWVQLLKEIAPRTDRVALLFNPVTAMAFQFLMPGFEAAVSSFGVQVSEAPVHAGCLRQRRRPRPFRSSSKRAPTLMAELLKMTADAMAAKEAAARLEGGLVPLRQELSDAHSDPRCLALRSGAPHPY
jgi:ABC transporter substrate binding protein